MPHEPRAVSGLRPYHRVRVDSKHATPRISHAQLQRKREASVAQLQRCLPRAQRSIWRAHAVRIARCSWRQRFPLPEAVPRRDARCGSVLRKERDPRPTCQYAARKTSHVSGRRHIRQTSSNLPCDICAGVGRGCSDGGDPLPVDLYGERGIFANIMIIIILSKNLRYSETITFIYVQKGELTLLPFCPTLFAEFSRRTSLQLSEVQPGGRIPGVPNPKGSRKDWVLYMR